MCVGRKYYSLIINFVSILRFQPYDYWYMYCSNHQQPLLVTRMLWTILRRLCLTTRSQRRLNNNYQGAESFPRLMSRARNNYFHLHHHLTSTYNEFFWNLPKLAHWRMSSSSAGIPPLYYEKRSIYFFEHAMGLDRW